MWHITLFWIGHQSQPIRLNSDILIHHISASWIPLHALNISAFLKFLIAANSLRNPSVPTSPVLDYQCVGCCLINAACSLGNTRAALCPLFLSNSAANSCRSWHQVLPNSNLNPFSLIQSFSYYESRWLVTADAADLSTTCSVCELQLGRITRCHKHKGQLARLHWNIIFCTLPAHIIRKHIC